MLARIIFISAGLVAAIACNARTTDAPVPSSVPVVCPPDKVTADINRLFMHESRNFSALVPRKEGGGFEQIGLWCSSWGYEVTSQGKTERRNCEVAYFDDVPAGKPSYAVEKRDADSCANIRWLEIHLHALDEVNGAGWSHWQKTGTRSGTTTVIE